MRRFGSTQLRFAARLYFTASHATFMHSIVAGLDSAPLGISLA